ncbi:MAG TPA: GDP-mannose 4,6-dehydratase [Stellaceae bacterium]|nr:GDP-mannose 4,6-dehydratase [Stellaceae bacterium]
MTRTALVTGVTGQDGAYLARFLLEKGYRVVGGQRRSSGGGDRRLRELRVADAVEYVDFDLAEMTNIMRALDRVKPDEIYNLAAQSFVALSFEQPLYTSDADGIGPLRILEAVRHTVSSARFYQASTSEMFGQARTVPQNETTPFYPRSPYGVAKLFAHWATINYRESYGIAASSGILFNHESPLRGREFVTRKITDSLARIRYGQLDVLELGNLDAKRDWGFAGDYVVGMWKMLQHDEPQDFVLATGEAHTVREFVQAAAEHLEFDIEWSGSGEQERGIDRRSGRVIVRVNPAFYRPAEVELLIGDARKARRVLGWKREVGFRPLVAMMTEADARRVRDTVTAGNREVSSRGIAVAMLPEPRVFRAETRSRVLPSADAIVPGMALVRVGQQRRRSRRPALRALLAYLPRGAREILLR